MVKIPTDMPKYLDKLKTFCEKSFSIKRKKNNQDFFFFVIHGKILKKNIT